MKEKSVFSFLRQLSTRHCSHCRCCGADRAAIDRYLVPTAATRRHRSGGRKGQTDRHASEKSFTCVILRVHLNTAGNRRRLHETAGAGYAATGRDAAALASR